MLANVITTQTDTITFGAFAIVAKVSGGESFTAAQAAVVLSILAIMMSPLRDLLHSVTTSLSAFAAFDRIQDFLSLDERIDGRIVVSDSDVGSVFPGANKDVPNGHDQVRIRDASFSWGETEVLKELNVDISKYTSGSLTIVIGPVGSGKSNFLKSLLGETSCIKGVVSVASSDISFCDQTPWLINATILDNIVGESGVFDETWFDTVVEACDLNTDLASLAKGPDTIVGDNGLKLSGGQKQRMVRLDSSERRGKRARLTLARAGDCQSCLLKEEDRYFRRCLQWSGQGD
jgi:ABC-type multidrug transport system fused ATPase/permease subunit